ncbi:MAG: orotate phosphoribosyltransferase [Candidatus Aenigmatarchaeota archaeon]|mgnify:CR=1 FL=1|nr:MAG: orotate phosphoribosyltransferase [Candidatus Aenigmarchaeota archaeon]
MEVYKEEFIDFLLRKSALEIGEFKLKSGRISPYFINTGVFDDGESIAELGYFYSSTIVDNFRKEDYDIIFGPAYKGIPLAVATVIGLLGYFDINKGYSFNRKEPKGYGEATKQDKQNWIVGKIKDGDRILMVDDVLTTGHTKYEAIDLLKSVADDLRFVGLVIAVDRKEVGTDGINAVKQFEQKTGIPVRPIVDILEIKTYLSKEGKISEAELKGIDDYLKKYGNEEVKRWVK